MLALAEHFVQEAFFLAEVVVGLVRLDPHVAVAVVAAAQVDLFPVAAGVAVAAFLVGVLELLDDVLRARITFVADLVGHRLCRDPAAVDAGVVGVVLVFVFGLHHRVADGVDVGAGLADHEHDGVGFLPACGVAGTDAQRVERVDFFAVDVAFLEFAVGGVAEVHSVTFEVSRRAPCAGVAGEVGGSAVALFILVHHHGFLAGESAAAQAVGIDPEVGEVGLEGRGVLDAERFEILAVVGFLEREFAGIFVLELHVLDVVGEVGEGGEPFVVVVGAVFGEVASEFLDDVDKVAFLEVGTQQERDGEVRGGVVDGALEAEHVQEFLVGADDGVIDLVAAVGEIHDSLVLQEVLDADGDFVLVQVDQGFQFNGVVGAVARQRVHEVALDLDVQVVGERKHVRDDELAEPHVDGTREHGVGNEDAVGLGVRVDFAEFHGSFHGERSDGGNRSADHPVLEYRSRVVLVAFVGGQEPARLEAAVARGVALDVDLLADGRFAALVGAEREHVERGDAFDSPAGVGTNVIGFFVFHVELGARDVGAGRAEVPAAGRHFGIGGDLRLPFVCGIQVAAHERRGCAKAGERHARTGE